MLEYLWFYVDIYPYLFIKGPFLIDLLYGETYLDVILQTFDN